MAPSRSNASNPTSSRLPPPSLFQGPPSRNASGVSLLPSLDLTLSKTASRTSNPPDHLHPLSSAQRPRRQSQNVPQSEHDRADALWMEMQNTLAEVELSAEKTNHLFSGEHAQALEELRTAQLALAQAWQRNENDADPLESSKQDQGVKSGPSAAANAPDAGGAIKGMEEETEADILMARKRREANDRYFQRVNAGVLDVVAKLEDVALAMRKVEKESRDIWSETESVLSTTDETSAG